MTTTNTIKARKDGSLFWGVTAQLAYEHSVNLLTLEFRLFIVVDPKKQLASEIRWGASQETITERRRAVEVATEHNVPFLADTNGREAFLSMRWQSNYLTPTTWYAPRVHACGFSGHAAKALTRLTKTGFGVLSPQESVRCLRAIFITEVFTHWLPSTNTLDSEVKPDNPHL